MNTKPNKANEIPAASGSGCDTRSKAQAMAEPKSGDRWAKGGGVLEMTIYPSGYGFKWSGPFSQSPPSTAWNMPWIPTFRRWCRDAEFLGGKE